MTIIPKGCTAINSFTIPFDKTEIDALFITYQQSGSTVVEKELSDCIFEEGMLKVVLSQEDTLKFDSNKTVYIQIRVRLSDGSVTKSNIISSRTDEVLKNEVI